MIRFLASRWTARECASNRESGLVELRVSPLDSEREVDLAGIAALG